VADSRKERMKKHRKLYTWLKKQIIELIEQEWYSQQIEGGLKFQNNPFVSHETI